MELDKQEIELSKKNTKAEALIKVVQTETEKVKFEKDKGIPFFNILQLLYLYCKVHKFKTNIIIINSCGRRRKSKVD